MKQWSRNLSDNGTVGIGASINWQVHYEPFNDEALARILCHTLVESLPTSGLHELLTSIANIYTFYQERSEFSYRLPTASYAELPAVEYEMAPEIVRPEFSVDYDE